MNEKQRKAADLRQRRVFGITLAEKEAGIAAQGGLCKICRRPPGKYQLSTDHDHAFDRAKVTVTPHPPNSPGWYMANAAVYGEKYIAHAASRPAARLRLKLALRRASIRGYLCQFCNRGLRYYQDKPERFDNAAKYIREFLAKVLDKSTKP